MSISKGLIQDSEALFMLLRSEDEEQLFFLPCIQVSKPIRPCPGLPSQLELQAAETGLQG